MSNSVKKVKSDEWREKPIAEKIRIEPLIYANKILEFFFTSHTVLLSPTILSSIPYGTGWTQFKENTISARNKFLLPTKAYVHDNKPNERNR